MSKSITFWSDMVKFFKNMHSDGELQGLYYHLEAYNWKSHLKANFGCLSHLLFSNKCTATIHIIINTKAESIYICDTEA